MTSDYMAILIQIGMEVLHIKRELKDVDLVWGQP
jgi:hypothetical protein